MAVVVLVALMALEALLVMALLVLQTQEAEVEALADDKA